MAVRDTPLRWDACSWEQIAALRQSGMDMAILPVGATEQHGRHLPTCVDTLSAETVALGASQRTGIPVLPALPYGCSLGHSHTWPGTLSLRPETLTRCVVDIAEWLRPAGFTRLLILNGHVTNVAPLRCALETIRHEMNEMRVALRSVWELTPEVKTAYEYDGGTNWHANDAETSLLLHLRPDLVDMAKAVDEPNRAAAAFFSHTVDRESETGVVGFASRGDAAFGRSILDACITGLASALEQALLETMPLAMWAGEPFDAVRPELPAGASSSPLKETFK